MGYGPAGLRGISKAQKIYDEEFVARNFFSSPLSIDVSKFSGDKYDYHIDSFFQSVSNVDQDIGIRLNSDATANYREYQMTGEGSSAFAGVADSDNQVLITEGIRQDIYPAFTRTKISGVSGEERKISLWSTGASNSNTRITVVDGYWKNTADEIDTIDFVGLLSSGSPTTNAHIIVYATLKEHSTSNWELVDTLTWSSEGSQKSFTSLDGDRDGEYRIVWEGYRTFTFRLNNDSGSNYIHQDLLNNGGTDLGINETLTEVESQRITFGLLLQTADFKIRNTSGVKRIITWNDSELGGSGYEQQRSTCWWSNTADNITSIDCTPSASTNGTAKLYRKRPTSIVSGDLPWEVVEEVDVSGNFSSGHTFSGLKGDDVTMYRLDYVGAGSPEIRVRINADSGSNYTSQQLQAISSTVSAASTTTTSLELADPNAGEIGYGVMYLYTKSGEERPSVGNYGSGTNFVNFRAGWWSNTADEVISLFVFAGDPNTITGGKLILSRLR